MWLYTHTHTHTHTYTLNQFKKSKKGITLIALVITIIILMILAGVAVATISGNKGILSKAKLAKGSYQNSTNEENEILIGYENEINVEVTSSREKTNEIEYEGMTIKIGNDHQLRYYYQDKEILPIYWYGFGINGSYGDSITPWYETNNVPKITRQDKNIIYSNYWTHTYQCIGGWTTKDKYNLGLYSKFHLILNSSSVETKMQYVNYTGNLGSNYTLNENRNIILTIPAFSKSDGPKEFIGNISNATGWYYLGIQS